MSKRSLPIAVLISGGGTTLQNLLQWQRSRDLPVDFKIVISSNARAAGLQYASEHAVRSEVVRKKDFADPQQHSEALFELCRQQACELVVMGGYLEHLLIPEDFTNRVINIHPSLIPAFSGKGYYGRRVHQAVLDYGVKITGCTVHFVDNQYDHGPIIAQRTCEVLPNDTPESLQARVFELERQIYPVTIAEIARGNITVQDGRVACPHVI